MKRIYLKPPKVEGNKITFRWEPNYIFRYDNYWVRYVELDAVRASHAALAEAYMPLCIGFSALGNAEIHLPYKINGDILAKWENAIRKIADRLYKRPFGMRIINGQNGCCGENASKAETALLFGGGAESLLTLARLRERGISPILVSYGGSSWPGSNPEINREKFMLDEKLSKDLSLKLINIRTNFKGLIDYNAWLPHLKKEVDIRDAALFLAFNIFSLVPVSGQLNIGRIVSGNEKNSEENIKYFSFSKYMTSMLKDASSFIVYESFLGELWKNEVLKELFTKYNYLAKYQYSCWKNTGERWCLNCEKCLRNYVGMRLYGQDPAAAGIDADIIQANMDNIISEIRWGIASGGVWLGDMWGMLYADAQRLHNKEFANLKNEIYKNYFLLKLICRLRRMYSIIPTQMESLKQFLRRYKKYRKNNEAYAYINR